MTFYRLTDTFNIDQVNNLVDQDSNTSYATYSGGGGGSWHDPGASFSMDAKIEGGESRIDADNIEARALELARLPVGSDPGDDNRQQAQQQLVSETAKVLNGELIELIESIRRDKEQTIDHDNLDELVRAEWNKDAASNAQALTGEFADYLTANQDSIAALTIFFSQPYRRRELSYALIRQVLDKLKTDKPKLAPLRVWQAYQQLESRHSLSPSRRRGST